MDLEANVRRFDGISAVYNAARPAPPKVLCQMLARAAARSGAASPPLPKVVVDLGCGTGLSTRYWADAAEKVIGVEPNEGMLDLARAEAAKLTTNTQFTFKQGLSSQTGLEDNSVDIVTVSQALHWMEPTSTFTEAVRILRPGGVFVAYDCDWPPMCGNWEAEKAYTDFMKEAKSVGTRHNCFGDIAKWEKQGHEQRMRDSGLFAYVTEIVVHSEEVGSGERLVQLGLSQGGVSSTLRAGVSEEEIGLVKFREKALQLLGTDERTFVWSYRVRLGYKAL
eukprot:TRINITY_DN16731_c0_g1_i1.p1 TRINITY_DN16731_c0_g1~~TRINITY_DN16731_c0_g1_i1.p1  ORF type:complete len:312 (-),score=57.15 TRINITY_DN16731_c0_g1_i1:31-867(-)